MSQGRLPRYLQFKARLPPGIFSAVIRKALCNDLPVALARLRDAIPTFGVPPYVLDHQRCIALQQHYWDPETRVSVIIAMTTSPGTFVIMLDSMRMYPSGESPV